MMTQTLAILLDAYRELNSKKMFWIVVILNAVAILGFGVLGVKANALTVLWYETSVPRALYLYKSIYSTGVVGIWFTWIAVLLALISTVGIFPDFLSSGSIDLFLAKPIGRLRLFLTKYLAGLLFVSIQVSLFAVLSFLVLGVRASIWEPGIFLAIPLVVVFFSYLFALCVLFGTVTRSTMAALMLTLLAWGAIVTVDFVDNRLIESRMAANLSVARIDDQIDALDRQIKGAQTQPDSEKGVAAIQQARDLLLTQRTQAQSSATVIALDNILYIIKSVTPKTRETTNILDRTLFSDAEMQAAAQAEQTQVPETRLRRGPPRVATQFEARLEIERKRSIWWIIGTSLLFEAACLGLAAWLFCRRDF